MNSKHYLMPIMGVLAAFSIGLSLWAHWCPPFLGDRKIMLLLQSLSNPLLTWVMEWTSFIFTKWPATLMVIVAGIIVGWRLGRRAGFMVLVAGILSSIDEAVKLAVGRPRPSPEQVQILGTDLLGMNQGNGYPSGHAFFATIFLGFLAYLLFTHIQNRRLRWFSLIILIMLVLLVGASRIYLGAHWPSDVLGGYIIGGFFLSILVWRYDTGRK